MKVNRDAGAQTETPAGRKPVEVPSRASRGNAIPPVIRDAQRSVIRRSQYQLVEHRHFGCWIERAAHAAKKGGTAETPSLWDRVFLLTGME